MKLRTAIRDRRSIRAFKPDPVPETVVRDWALRRSLKIGGQLIIGTFAANGPEQCSGLPVIRFEPETLWEELQADFRLLDCLHVEHRTPWGDGQHFQYSRFIRI